MRDDAVFLFRSSKKKWSKPRGFRWFRPKEVDLAPSKKTMESSKIEDSRTPSYNSDIKEIMEKIQIKKDMFTMNKRVKKWITRWLTSSAIKSVERVCEYDLCIEKGELTDDIFRYLADNTMADIDLIISQGKAKSDQGVAALAFAFTALPFGGAVGSIGNLLSIEAAQNFINFWIMNKPYLTLMVTQMLKKQLGKQIDIQTEEYFKLNNNYCKQYPLTEALHNYIVFGKCAFKHASHFQKAEFKEAMGNHYHVTVHKKPIKEYFYVQKAEDDNIDVKIDHSTPQSKLLKEERDLTENIKIKYIDKNSKTYIFKNIRRELVVQRIVEELPEVDAQGTRADKSGLPQAEALPPPIVVEGTIVKDTLNP